MRILFYPLNEYGHMLPTFPLARALAARGHEIVYACSLDFRSEIESRGFRCVPLHRDILPLGRLAELHRMSAAEREAALTQMWTRMALEAVQGRTEQQFHDISPSIVLVDVIHFIPSFVIHRLGIPMLRVSTSLSQRLDELPPITTGLRPDAPQSELEAVRHEARANIATRRPIRYAIDAFSARCAFPVSDVSFGAFTPFLRTYPEVVLCPSVLDFPRSSEPPAYLALPSDLERAEHVPDSLQQFCTGTTPLIFVSLGSQSGRYEHAPTAFRAVLELLRARPDWRAVIAAGDKYTDDALFAAAPANVFVIRRAPQIWLLRRASVFVTHAGLGSLREAIAMRVPMIALPQSFDQPGNAARIAWHEIGVTLDPATATRAALESRIERLLAERDQFRARLDQIAEACEAEIAQCSAVELVEETAERGLSPVRPSTWLPAPTRLDGGAQPAWLFIGHDGQLTGGHVLRHGSRLEIADASIVEHGVAGFVACTDIGDALECTTGPIVARVEISGATAASGPQVIGSAIRCVWLVDATSALLDHADWCTEGILESDPDVDPKHREVLLAGIRTLRTLRASGIPHDEIVRVHDALQDAIKHLWYRGYDMLLETHASRAPHEVARFCRAAVTRQLARRAAGSHAGTVEGAERYAEQYRAVADRSAADLQRRIIVLV